MKNTLLAITALSLVGTAVIAAPQKHHARSEGQPYVGLQLGYGGFNTDSEISYNNVDVPANEDNYEARQEGLTYRIAGGYLFNLSGHWQLGPELAYMGLPESKYTFYDASLARSAQATINGYAIDLLANARYHFNNGLYVEGKAGFSFINQKTKDATGATKTTSGTLPKIALGVGYNFSQHVGMNFSASSTFDGAKPNVMTGHDINKIANTGAIALGVNYMF